jgi:hypothetical protein
VKPPGGLSISWRLVYSEDEDPSCILPKPFFKAEEDTGKREIVAPLVLTTRKMAKKEAIWSWERGEKYSLEFLRWFSPS